MSLKLCRLSPDSHCDADSTSRCRKLLDSAYVSPADFVSDTRSGGGDAGRAANGDGFDTADFGLAVSCLSILEVYWLGVSERERRRFSSGVSERERRVFLQFTSSLVSANRD